MYPSVLRLAVLAIRTWSGSSWANVPAGESFGAQFGLDRLDDVVAKRSEISDPDPGPEDGEQRSGVGEQEALVAVDPGTVQIPVVVAWSGLAERDLAAEKIEHLLRAPHDHPANLPAHGA